jgi:hypothetical protein
MTGVDGMFKIWSIDKTVTFDSNFGDGPAIVTEGYAGWQVVQRPKEVGLTVWQGRNPMAIEIPFMIDFLPLWDSTFADEPGVQCENQVTNLEQLCGIGGHAQPSVCFVDGGGLIPHDYSIYKGHQWVIEQLTWDKQMEVRSGTSGRRLRCGGVITIRQYMTPSEILQRIGPRDRARKPRYYKVKRGDNLEKIAAKFYGNANMWKKIANANHLRDPRSLKIGRKIRIP